MQAGVVLLNGLRLQHLDTLDLARLDHFAERAGSPKLRRAAGHVRDMAAAESDTYEVFT